MSFDNLKHPFLTYVSLKYKIKGGIHLLYHGTIIQTGTTRKKIPCYMRDSACRWFIVENAKIFRSYVKHF